MDHTPGPFAVQEGEECCFHEGNRYAITQSGEDQGEEWFATIAEVWPSADGRDRDDAYLFAAAPDQHKALTVLADWPRASAMADGVLSSDPEIGLANVRRFARAAIGKAKP